jgi:hypothetical protein
MPATAVRSETPLNKLRAVRRRDCGAAGRPLLTRQAGPATRRLTRQGLPGQAQLPKPAAQGLISAADSGPAPQMLPVML